MGISIRGNTTARIGAIWSLEEKDGETWGIDSMAVQDKLAQYGDAIVLFGFVIGITYIADILPRTVDLLGLAENVKYVYIGVIVLAAYTFFKFHKGHSAPSFQRSVGARSLSDPGVRRDIAQQRSSGAHSAQPRYPAPPPPSAMSRPSKGVFDMFNRD